MKTNKFQAILMALFAGVALSLNTGCQTTRSTFSKREMSDPIVARATVEIFQRADRTESKLDFGDREHGMFEKSQASADASKPVPIYLGKIVRKTESVKGEKAIIFKLTDGTTLKTSDPIMLNIFFERPGIQADVIYRLVFRNSYKKDAEGQEVIVKQDIIGFDLVGAEPIDEPTKK